MSKAADFAAVAALLHDYLDGLYACDTACFARVFHPQAHYGCVIDGQLLQLDMAQYFAIIAQRPSPQSQGHGRTDAILSIEFAGPETAAAKVACSIPGKSFIDLLTLVHIGGRWQILAKVFHATLTA